MNEGDAIRRLVEDRVRAMEEKDAAAAVAVLDPAVIAFEVAGPLQVTPDQARDIAATQAWLDTFEDGPRVELSEMKIYADGDVAFCHSINRLSGRMKDRREVDLAMRSTLGFVKRDGEWTIVHAHTSVPR